MVIHKRRLAYFLQIRIKDVRMMLQLKSSLRIMKNSIGHGPIYLHTASHYWPRLCQDGRDVSLRLVLSVMSVL